MEIIVRCPFCGDSQNTHHHHLYIKKDFPYPYFCQRCSTKGIISRKFLSVLGIKNTELKSIVQTLLKKLNILESDLTSFQGSNFSLNSITQNNVLSKVRIPKNGFSVVPYAEEDIDVFLEPKLDYILSRNPFFLETNVFKELRRFKVVLSIEDFYAYNEIKVSEKQLTYLRKLDETSVSFLTTDSNYLISRSITKSTDQSERYVDLNITGLEVSKFYAVTTKINLLNPFIELYISEGLFDIHKTYHFYRDPKINQIFASPSGKGFLNIIDKVIELGFTDIRLVFVKDNDVDDSFYVKILKHSLVRKITKLKKVEILKSLVGKDLADSNLKSQTKLYKVFI
jgi:hypothetical protein